MFLTICARRIAIGASETLTVTRALKTFFQRAKLINPNKGRRVFAQRFAPSQTETVSAGAPRSNRFSGDNRNEIARIGSGRPSASSAWNWTNSTIFLIPLDLSKRETMKHIRTDSTYSRKELAEDLRALAGIDIADKKDLAIWYEKARGVLERLSSSRTDRIGYIPETVWHYLADADIRLKDRWHREAQNREIARIIEMLQRDDSGHFLESGERPKVSYGTPALLLVALHICCFAGIVATVAAMLLDRVPTFLAVLLLPGGWFLGMAASLVGSVQPTLRGGFLAWAALFWGPVLFAYLWNPDGVPLHGM
ncbi:MAG: hypothetical protein ACREPX_12785 [Rhodanobacteraceae bacterium]